MLFPSLAASHNHEHLNDLEANILQSGSSKLWQGTNTAFIMANYAGLKSCKDRTVHLDGGLVYLFSLAARSTSRKKGQEGMCNREELRFRPCTKKKSHLTRITSHCIIAGSTALRAHMALCSHSLKASELRENGRSYSSFQDCLCFLHICSVHSL